MSYQEKKNPGFTASLSASFLLHLVLFLLLLWWQQFMPEPAPVQTTYYVDVVNMPVAAPRAGSPQQAADTEDLAPPPPPEPAQPEMSAPTVPVTSSHAVLPKKQTQKQADSASFDQQMAKLQTAADARRQAQRLDELRTKVDAQGRSGMPKGVGSQTGSDYTAYIHSRLKDAFQETISYQSKAPFVQVRLVIAANGRLLSARFEKSSKDQLFELAVRRAINMAEPQFVPPPDDQQYEGLFVFRPEGVAQQ